MNKKIHFLLLTSLIMLVMVVSALHPIIARADDSTPSAPATQPPAADTSAPAVVATQPPAADTSVVPADTSAAPADTAVAPASTSEPSDNQSTTSVSTSVASDNESATSVDTSTTMTDATSTPAATSTLMETVPTGTPVVVLDATSTPVPLATQAAADIIQTGDPIWCPAGAAPGVGINGCSATGYTSLQSLLKNLKANQPTQPGTIWIASSYQSSVNDSGITSFTLNGNTNFSTMGNYALTLQGGWNGTSILGSNISGTSEFDGASITITNWKSDVTLKEIVISGVTSGDALTVKTSGNITLHNVKSNHNSGGVGAKLDNTSGSGTSITVASDSYGNSEFNSNGSNGLAAYSNGDVTLYDVTANGNTGSGVLLGNSTNPIDGNIYVDTNSTNNISGSSYFGESGAGNGSNGLAVYSSGDITLYNVTANGNTGGNGVLLGNSSNPIGGNIYVDTDSSNDVSGSSTFGEAGTGNGNGVAGLKVYANGDITLAAVIADNNTDSGVHLDNTTGTGTVTVDDSTFGDSAATGNGQAGIRVYSNGAITLTDVIADHNGDSGARLDNTTGTGTVTVDDSTFGDSAATGNGQAGIRVYSNGAITLTDVIADGNADNGALLDNHTAATAQDITVSTSLGSIYNDFSNNYHNGLKALSFGKIGLYNVEAYNNGWGSGAGGLGDGAYLKNAYLGGTGNIYVSFGYFGLNNSSSTTYGNGSNGLEAYSNSSIDLESVEANWNNYQGAILDTTGLVSGASIYVDQDFTVSPASYPVSSFDYNQGHGSVANPAGLQVYGGGDINIWNADASCNGTSSCSSSSSGFPTFGMMLDNTSGSGSISVDDSFFGQFDFNSADGIEAFSNGAIALTDVVASNNIGGDGAYLDNCIDNGFGFCKGSGNVIVDPGTSDSSAFNYNYDNGLEVVSTGSISLDTVTADSNVWGDGALLDNCYNPNDVCEGLNGNGITVLNSIFGDSAHGGGNTGNGLEAYSNGLISLSGVTAELNQENGAALENDRGSTTDGITVSTSTFGDSSLTNGNGGDGLDAYSTGTITLTGLMADGNWNYGAYLNNCDWDVILSHCAAGGDVSVSNSNFDSNITSLNGEKTGLDIHSNGNVSLNSISASNNLGGDGADVNGSLPVGTFASLTIQNSTFDNNYSTENDWGVGFYAAGGHGNANLVNVIASGNSLHGTYIETLGNISIDPSTFNNNGDVGLVAYSGGTITLTDVTADTNDSDGAYLTGSSITATNSHFDGNTDAGLVLHTGGNATIICSSADNDKAGYGIYGAVNGTLTLDGVSLAGYSGSGNNATSGVLVNDPTYCNPGGGKGGNSGSLVGVGGPGPLPWNMINVPDSGGQGNPLSCSQYVGTELVLPNSDHVLLPCPIGSTPGTSGSLRGLSNSNLPGKLDSKFTFVSSFDAEVNPALTGGMITVSFKIPSGKQGPNFAILHWDGTKWVSLGGTATPPGYFSVTTSLTGDFVLVTQ
jgi:Right handed beta helix region